MSLVAFSRQVSPGRIGLLISAQPARRVSASSAEAGLMRDKSRLQIRERAGDDADLRRAHGESLPDLSPPAQSPAFCPDLPLAKERE